MSTRAFFLNSTLAQYGEEEINHVQNFLIEQGVLNSLGSDWEDFFANGDLKVTERAAGANMSVDVAPGWAILSTERNGKTFKVFCQNLSIANIVVATNSTGSNRIDAVILRVSRTAEPNVLTNNIVTLQVVTGNGTDAMTDEEIATIIDSDDDFIRLADITVPNATSDITDGDIEDTRVRAKTTDQIDYAPTIINFRILATDPNEANLAEGMLWFNSDDNVLKYYNGADIISLEPTSFIEGDGIDITDGTISAKIGAGLEFDGDEIVLDTDYLPLADVQTYTSGASNWTKPTGAKKVLVQMWGGGGGGGGASSGNGCAGGGGGGSYIEHMYDASQLNGTEAYSVGSGGTGGVGNADGGAGNNSTFKGLIAYGGGGGSRANGGSGGGGGGGAGSSAKGSSASSTNSGQAGGATLGGAGGGSGVAGGASSFGGGGGGGAANTGAIGGESANGGGGGGGASTNFGAPAKGGDGGKSMYGGGGGGAGSSSGTPSVGGVSMSGGTGGIGQGSNTNGTDGGVRGGGGGGASSSSGDKNGGNGGRGEIRITTFF